MSMHDRATAAVLAQIMMAADGALFGFGVSYVAYRSIRKYVANSSALLKIRDAPAVSPSDLRSILTDGDDSSSSGPDGGDACSSNCGVEKLVVVRGSVDVKSAVENLMGSHLVSATATGDEGVILQISQTCIYNEWKGFLGWTADLRNIISGSLKEQTDIDHKKGLVTQASDFPLRFLLFLSKVQNGLNLIMLFVNMEGSIHPLPLITVYQNLQPIHAAPYTFLQAICGLEYPVGMLYEEKILPLGKDITAVGMCSLKNGIFEIKSCKDLPYFLSALSKDEIVADLSFKTKLIMWSGLVFGTLAIGILGYSVARNWARWKEWRSLRQTQQQNDSTISSNEPSNDLVIDDETEDIQDGELCVICLTRRRRSAFVPCGHLVCCPRCALSVEREVAPKCPLCRQAIRTSIRIYDS